MKSPEEIKKGLAYCDSRDNMFNGCAGGCPYWCDKYGCHSTEMKIDALAYIQQLEKLASSRLRRMKLFKGRAEGCLAECVQLRNRVKELENQIADTGKMVRHAHWIPCQGKSHIWYCSECGERISYNQARRTYKPEKKSVYEVNRWCRGCGARMDGGNEKMSGGSMNYICYRIEEEADNMGDRELIALIRDVAKLMHDREWFLSGDYGDETWNESVKAFKKKWFKGRTERLKGLIEETFAEAKKECMAMIGEKVESDVRWEPIKDSINLDLWKCSGCGITSMDASQYCPHCGAKMGV